MRHSNRLKRKKDRQKNGHKENRRRGDYLKKCLENFRDGGRRGDASRLGTRAGRYLDWCTGLGVYKD
jgi:hypothetical protein